MREIKTLITVVLFLFTSYGFFTYGMFSGLGWLVALVLFIYSNVEKH